MTVNSYCIEVFLACQTAIVNRQLIKRLSRGDKEYHFQNWFAQRLRDGGILFDHSGRNSYPDFVATQLPEGYEVKGLAWPGREASYDANSQVPTGLHNGRTIYYVFGRYPSAAVDDEYPVVDFVMCHGDFLNARHEYVHKNRSIRGFGSYGDILIRDRKMYVAPTPYALATGTTGERTLILPANMIVSDRLEPVGRLMRIEAANVVVGYEFDLTTNTLKPRYIPNPNAGQAHNFIAYRVRGEGGSTVAMASNLRSIEDEGE